MTHHDVDKFFDAISDDYTQKIERCFPRYREMLCALLHCLPSDNRGASILELGCGTGNLSLLLTQMFPSAKICFVDISSESLETCRQRVGGSRQYSFENTDIRDLVFVLCELVLYHISQFGRNFLCKFKHLCRLLKC